MEAKRNCRYNTIEQSCCQNIIFQNLLEHFGNRAVYNLIEHVKNSFLVKKEKP